MKHNKYIKSNEIEFNSNDEAVLLNKIRKHLNTDTIQSKDIPSNVTDLLNAIVSRALKMKSSDIHIEPQEDKVLVRFRIDGLLREIMSIDKEIEQVLVFKVKINAKLRTDEHFAPQDGRIAFMIDDKKVDTRVSILPTTKGEKIVMRLLTTEGKGHDLDSLGLVGKNLEIVTKAYKKPYGMILAVGPTGSGKTTTLYAILEMLNSKDVNITTVEDPVEYDIRGINHIQINTKADLTFANGLRAILRQDPDIIMIGEIRDSETAKIAINAAMTGHLVLSTLHTNDAVTTIPRLIDMGVEEFLVANTVNVVIAQRLARRLCENCKEETTLTKKEIEDVKVERPDIAALLKENTKIFHEVGCGECGGTGYRGRVGLYEILEVHEKIRRLIAGKQTVDDIFKAARESGLVLIAEDGVDKVQQGIVSISELVRVTALKE
jgi:type IV pilus assembly protein PilB